MIEQLLPNTTDLMVTGSGAALGFVRMMMDMKSEREKALNKRLYNYDKSADNASKRGGTWIRKVIILMILTFIIVVGIFAVYEPRTVLVPMEQEIDLILFSFTYNNYQQLDMALYVLLYLKYAFEIAIGYYFGRGGKL